MLDKWALTRSVNEHFYRSPFDFHYRPNCKTVSAKRRVKVYKKNCIKSEDGQRKKKVGFSKCIGNFLVGDTSWRRKQKFRWKQKIFSFCKEAVVMHFWSFSLVWVVHWMHEEKQPNGDCCKNFKSEKDWTDLMLRHYPKWLLHTYLQNENGSAEGKLLLARLYCSRYLGHVQ